MRLPPAIIGGKDLELNAISCLSGTYREVGRPAERPQLTANVAAAFTDTWERQGMDGDPDGGAGGRAILLSVGCRVPRPSGPRVSAGSVGTSFLRPATPQALACNGKTWSRQAVPAA